MLEDGIVLSKRSFVSIEIGYFHAYMYAPLDAFRKKTRAQT